MQLDPQQPDGSSWNEIGARRVTRRRNASQFQPLRAWRRNEARRAFEAMMTMRKIDVAAIDAARRG